MLTLKATRERTLCASVCASLALLCLTAPAHAGPAEQAAKRIYQRIAGTLPPPDVLTSMVTDICGSGASTCTAPSPGDSKLVTAAGRATQAPGFYNETLKTFVNPWTNRDGNVYVPLNDYTATVIGMVRDNVPFNTALSADILYTVNGSGLPAPSPADNAHYAAAETNGVDLSTALKATTQSAVYGLPTAATAGLLTTRTAAQAFFINGTNRAMFRFTMINHLCNDMPTLQDTSRPADRIRQDVARSPGGDSRVFLNSCSGCHTGMDAMAQAFAYYNFVPSPSDSTKVQLVYTPGAVQPKYLINSQNFPYGFITPDDSWSNRWREGTNQWITWSPGLPGSGNGAKSLGQELAASDAYAQCQVSKVYQAVCYRAPDSDTVTALKGKFVQGGYLLKSVFEQAAASCPGT